ncbi:DUF4956 domain-containing protein [Sphingomicrobium nitratireducens]|uniref:DUF4956 domain-containing protein n=1 Tax=Sphingomicrobium nitratireducens TaxID=2964666 RepID=UPI002240B166
MRLSWALTLFYLVVTGSILAASALIPGFVDFLPIGGAENLLRGPGDDPFDSIDIGATRVGTLTESLLWLVFAIGGALLTVLPVSWTYMASRARKEYDQSLVETIIVIPIAVTAIVVIVHNSLALAFSLAGIVGGVRFRNTLKSSGDALYILLAIGIGLSAGIGALEVALVMSVLFNFTILFLWLGDYGGLTGAHRYFRDNHEDRRDEGDVDDGDEETQG